MEAFLMIFTDIARWIDTHPLGAADILFKSASANRFRSQRKWLCYLHN